MRITFENKRTGQSHEIEVKGQVQLTYEELRVDGQMIAYYQPMPPGWRLAEEGRRWPWTDVHFEDQGMGKVREELGGILEPEMLDLIESLLKGEGDANGDTRSKP